MISYITSGIHWAWVGLKWLIVTAGTITIGLLYELKARADRVADISLIHCVNMISRESDLTVWEQQLKAEKAEIIEREQQSKR